MDVADCEIPNSADELKRLVERMRDELMSATRENAELKTALEREHAKYEDLKREIFGKKSEKSRPADPKQPELFNEAERDAGTAPQEERTQLVRRKMPKRGGRRRPPIELEHVERLHDLSDDEKRCPCCGKLRPRIGEDRSEEIEIIPARAVVVEHVRPKYGPCDCEAFAKNEAKPIVEALAPAKIAPGSLFSNRTIAFFLTAKYADGLPFYRQEKVVARMGIEIARGTMARLTMRVGTALAPVLERLQKDLRACLVVGMDETVVQVLKEQGKKPESESRMWVARGTAARGSAARGYRNTGPILLFAYSPSRSGSVAAAMLGPEFKGYLQTDGYSGYTAIGKREGVVHVGCWAHIRRKFHHLGDTGPTAAGTIAVRMIASLYRIEDKYRALLANNWISEGEFTDLRKEETATVFVQIKGWLLEMAKTVAPSSPLGLAVAYALGQFEAATRYVEHYALTPDNNLVENAIRPFVIGRKNWLFCDTPKGAWASATIYSLVETARANGHEPYRYLCYLFDRLPGARNGDEIAALLPYNLKPNSY